MVPSSVFLVSVFAALLFLPGCATTGTQGPGRMTADQVAEGFLRALRESNERKAHQSFTRELAQRLPYPSFSQLMDAFGSHWGKLQDYDSVLMPFHVRSGESHFIPDGVDGEDMKRYTYEMHFERATVNCDLTVIPEEGAYKVAWLSFWGSNSSITPEVQDKIEELFHKPLFPGR